MRSAGDQPLRVFHATNAEEDFDIFDRTEDIGFHFGTLETANRRAEDIKTAGGNLRLVPAYLSLQNPLRVNDLRDWCAKNVLNEFERLGLLTLEDEAKWFPDSVGREEVRDFLASKGYDGLVYENEVEGGGDSYVALRPQQIKSAIAADEFDPKYPSIIDAKR